ncbi:MAG TPA: OmpA family protein [Nevskiaceae bacterium]|nr:OmpA family protein [Nevskiaceae bacterium]
MQRKAWLSALLALGLAGPALAQDEEYAEEEGYGEEDSSAEEAAPGVIRELGNRFYVAPMASYLLSDTDRNLDDGLGGSLAIGKRFTRALALELTGSYLEADPESGSLSSEFTSYGLGALVFPSRTLPNLYGLLNVSRGQTDQHPRVGGGSINYGSTLFDSGLGYLIPLRFLGPGAALRAEARYHFDSHDEERAGQGAKDDFYDGLFNLGVLIPLGSLPVEEAPPAEEVAVVAVADEDNDGVTDDVDQCPGTPAGAVVNELGCEVDSDGDGVVDRLDRCPDTPVGAQVNEEGCPIETPCRTPAPGEAISLEGCGTGDTVVLRGVNFNFNEATLTANAKVILDQVGDALLAASEIEVEIGGHTDARGSDEYNQALSQRRADSVKQYLVGRGVEASRMTTAGYGESQPVADNETDEGRELNRRVELKVQGGEEAGAGLGTGETVETAPEAAAVEETAAEDAVTEEPVAEEAAEEQMLDAMEAEEASLESEDAGGE